MRSLPTAVLLAAAAFLSLPATPAAAHAAAAGELPEIVAYVVPHSHDGPAPPPTPAASPPHREPPQRDPAPRPLRCHRAAWDH